MKILQFVPEKDGISVYKGCYSMQVIPHPIVDDKIHQSYMQLNTCRDLLIHYLRHDIINKKSDLDQTRIMFHQADGSTTWLEIGHRLINLVEKHLGWTESVLFEVPYKHKMHLIVGSKKWISSPILLSLYLCIINAPRTNSVLVRIKTYESLITYFRKQQKKLNVWVDSDYTYYLAVNIDKWPLILDNYVRLFKGRKDPLSNYDISVALRYDEKEAYEKEDTRLLKCKLRNRLENEGFHKFCQFESGDVKLTRRFKTVCKNLK